METPISTAMTGSLNTLIVNNQHAICRISLFGGHVLSYMPKYDGRERLWMSDAAILDANKPIRGGIPVCWPWFANSHGQDDATLPSHGFLRTQPWTLVSQNDGEDGTEILLAPSSVSGPGFTFACNVSLKIVVGKQLTVTLITENTGDKPFPLSMALHSYFSVSDINGVQITGIEGAYLDKLQDWARLPTPSPYRISAETDRIHLDTPEEVILTCADANTLVRSQGHDSIVVWNPWAENAEKMADMDASGYQTMVCIETALTQGFTLQPGAQHQLTQVIG